MGKYSKITVLIAIIILVSKLINADIQPEVEKYTIDNPTGDTVSTYISTTTIIPNQSRIIGFCVNPHSTGTSQAALWDETSSTTHHTDNQFGELSNPASKGDCYNFPHIKKLTRQLLVTQTANTNVVVYYTK